MREHPILFAGRLVRAILEGRKTQTRRLMRGVPDDATGPLEPAFAPGAGESMNRWAMSYGHSIHPQRCPYGAPGHRLWVRETWLELDKKHWGDPSLPREAVYNHPWPRANACAYAADTERGGDGDDARRAYGYRWKPSIHMPRWASRITLEVTGIRVERLQAITALDIAAEGFATAPGESLPAMRLQFGEAWDSINAERGAWATNPFVWVVSFKPIAIARAA